MFNATAVLYGALGYLTLWQNDPGSQPMVSTLNALDGWITNNMAIVPTANGKIDAYASSRTQLILDISGYFAPWLDSESSALSPGSGAIPREIITESGDAVHRQTRSVRCLISMVLCDTRFICVRNFV